MNIKIDVKKLNEIIKVAKEKFKVKVGVLNGGNKFNDKDKKKSITVAGYGWVNEMGSVIKNIPRRSFIKEPLESNLYNELLKVKKEIKKTFFEDVNGNKAYHKLGAVGMRIVEESFEKNNWAPNSPITIKKKRSSKPLIDTGRLRKTINYKVIKNNV